jgi:hypothetical protein
MSPKSLQFYWMELFRNNIMNKAKIIAEIKHYFCKN